MNASLLKGAPVAAAINEKTKALVEELSVKGVTPCLALVKVGDRDDNAAYERNILKRCDALGVKTELCALPEDCGEAALLALVDRLNADDKVHGVLVFLPLPKGISTDALRDRLSPEKDVDGITYGSMAAVYSGQGSGFAPCTARAALEILKFYEIPLAGKRAAVVGRSLVIGKPAAMLLDREGATVTICHSKTPELSSVCASSDIVVAAMGKAGALKADCFRAGQTVVDVGINFTSEGKMCGDVAFDEAEGIVSAITPVPGGVGAVTTAILANNAVLAAFKK